MEAKKLRHSAEEIANRLEKPQRTKDGWLARCPAHPDKSPSLSIKDGDKGFPLYYCYAGCGYEEIEAALGILPKSPVAPPPPAPSSKPKPEAEGEAVAEALTDRLLMTGEELAIPPEFYHQPHHDFMQRREQFFPYLDANREIWATVRRVDVPGQPKRIQPTTTLPDGPRPLYLLPQLLEQGELSAAIMVVEGERCVHAALAYEPSWRIAQDPRRPQTADSRPIMLRVAMFINRRNPKPSHGCSTRLRREVCRAGSSRILTSRQPAASEKQPLPVHSWSRPAVKGETFLERDIQKGGVCFSCHGGRVAA